ncbi:uncharacterized protein VICG_00400 [Vittaforma corneae ATCC 50505]|uniref:Uncharacterized protein n=1 Tax=Vittaforma corneae (strain ATCC 50505) TaxID=993615 RepID=L2GP44_VITCO|nr:uncharacterized protein VICG_00400 [Vittaforma corneae ATCC 50505]ELA42648.1 hypothetical protein VICG_00400 [Vittaforma corneae ATCC 50505]
MILALLLMLASFASTRPSFKNLDDIFDGNLKGSLSQSSESDTSNPLGGDLSPDDPEEQRKWAKSIVKSQTGGDIDIQEKTDEISDEESNPKNKTYMPENTKKEEEKKSHPNTKKKDGNGKRKEATGQGNGGSNKKDQGYQNRIRKCCTRFKVHCSRYCRTYQIP